METIMRFGAVEILYKNNLTWIDFIAANSQFGQSYELRISVIFNMKTK